MGKIKNKILIKAAWFFEKYLYHKADLVITCSEGQKDNILNRFPDIDCVTIPHGGDLDLFGNKDTVVEVVNETKIFTHLGSLGFIHNCKLIIEAAIHLQQVDRENDIKIIFIGDGSERIALEVMKKEYNLVNVEFMGLKPKLELPKWVKSSRATLFTTLNNVTQNTSCPNKIFDSFAAGVPIIQTTTGWIKTLIENEHCGINVSPDNPVELAQAILSMADDDKKHGQLAINTERVAQRLFNRDILANQYLDEIKSLVKLQ